MTKSDKHWRVWDRQKEYGQRLYRRAVGELPEMESAKATAKLMKGMVHSGDHILDVGCGAGHYLRSLRRIISCPFDYTGADATAGYIRLARKAWAKDRLARFAVEDAYDLSFADESFDLVISCNLLLHLPSIRRPLAELIRVARRAVVVRTLVGERSFRIQEVHPAAGRDPA